MRRKGFFITFEGGEGCGKTTQLRLLAGRLRRLGHVVVTTKEPGAGPLGPVFRKLLLSRSITIPPAAELFLFLADRAQHVEKVIRPHLARGAVVLCDRYEDSTLAYQGGGRGFPIDFLQRANTLASGGLKADLTFFLDLPPQDAFRRLRGRNRGRDRMETEDRLFHERVRCFYRALARRHPRRVVCISAQKPVKEVFQAIWERLPAAFRKPVV